MQSKTNLYWMRFNTWKEVIDDDDGKYQFPCVYVVGDVDGIPLYIGLAAQKEGEVYAGGLRARYYHDWTVLDACMEGTGKGVYIAEVSSRDEAKSVEATLIFENKPKYNCNGKKNPPEEYMHIDHTGDSPKFVLH